MRESMIVLGLTGSIGMGKSTAAGFFAEAGVPVHDADAVVHRLYAGEAVPAIEAAFPGTTSDAKVDRGRLAERVLADPAALKRLEAIVHPLVRRDEEQFLAQAEAADAEIVVLNIPLLFETGGDRRCDAVVVVSAPAEMQRERVMSRPGMTEEKFASLLGKQVPDAEKRRRADFVVDSSKDFDSTRAQIRAILRDAARLLRRRPS
jgi:dephospho-CoA kinase